MKVLNKLSILAAMALLISACQSTSTVDGSASTAGQMEDASSIAASSVAVDRGGASDTGSDMPANLERVVYFDFDQSALKPESRTLLLQHAAQLRTNNRRVVLEGHTDERGTREYNIALGERRANSVRDFLVLQGINANRIETVSYGEERPAVLGSNESAWSRNRRVELRY